MQQFELAILDWIQANLQSGFMDKFMPFITVFGDAGIFWIAIAVLFLFTKKYRKVGLGMAFALIIGLLVCNIYLKPTVARIRPYDFQEQLGVIVNLLIEKQHDFSFPSGHTIASFEAAVVILLNNKKLGIPDSATGLRTLLYAVVMTALYIISFMIQQRWVFAADKKK